MEITRERLLANGCKEWNTTIKDAYQLRKILRPREMFPVIDIKLTPCRLLIHLEVLADRYELPNITSMEALAQLEYLLSDTPAYTLVDSAPLDKTISERFGGGLVQGG